MQTQQIFLSYSRSNAEFALNLAVKLKEAGANLWIDQLDIAVGSRWDVEVGNALDKAECLLVILSQKSVSSNNVLDEVSYALDSNKRVIPVLIDECVLPFRLRRLQYIDFSHDFDHAFETLLRCLNEDTNANVPVYKKEGSALREIDTKDTTGSKENRSFVKEPPTGSINTARAAKSKTARNAIMIVAAIVIVAIVAFVIKQNSSGSNQIQNAQVGTSDSSKPVSVAKDASDSGLKGKNNLAQNTGNKTDVGTVTHRSNKHAIAAAGKDGKVTQVGVPLASDNQPFRVVSGKFVFHTGDKPRARGDVIISIWQQGISIWSRKVPAESQWATNTDFSFEDNINTEIKPKTLVVMKMQYCSPGGKDIEWSGNLLFTLKRSDNYTIIYKSVFDLTTAGGAGIPKCTGLQLNRVGAIGN